MADKPQQSNGNGGGYIGTGVTAARYITSLTANQLVMLAFSALVVMVVYVLIYLGPRMLAEMQAANMRQVAEMTERAREDRERDREDRVARETRDREANTLRDEKFLTAFAAESERNRQAQAETSKVQMTAVMALTKEVVKLQVQVQQLTDHIQKLNQKIGPGEVFDLIPCPLPMRECPPVAPMPRAKALTRG